MSQDQRTLIALASLKENKGNYAKAAKDTRIPEDEIRQIDARENKKYNFTQEGWGRPDIRRYAIARRSILSQEGWDNKDPKIQKAYELYDKGMCEIATGRDGMMLILYAIPRRHRDMKRKPYFTAKAP